jgi:hypothetical protein
MTRRTLTSTLAVLTLAVALVALPGQETASAGSSRADVLASANATESTPTANDSVADTDRLSRGGHAHAAATASTDCPGCHAQAQTVQIIYADRQAAADNVAAAWSSCADCSSTALAVQVLVLPARHGSVNVTNRALAVNAACEACTSDALAVQFVLTGGNRHQISDHVRALLDDLAVQLGTDLTAPHDRGALMAAPQAPGTASIDAVGDALAADLGASLTTHVETRHG